MYICTPVHLYTYHLSIIQKNNYYLVIQFMITRGWITFSYAMKT